MTEKMIIGGIDMWGNMMATQQLLDAKVSKVHGVDLTDKHGEQIMALRDEVMEYAKSTKCFKYWSLKEEDPFHVRLEEFSDGIHFYLQQALRLGLMPQDLLDAAQYANKYISRGDKRKALTHLLSRAMDHLKTPSQYLGLGIQKQHEDLLESFTAFMAAGRVDGFTDENIERGYYLKNKVNQERLKNGY